MSLAGGLCRTPDAIAAASVAEAMLHCKEPAERFDAPAQAQSAGRVPAAPGESTVGTSPAGRRHLPTRNAAAGVARNCDAGGPPPIDPKVLCQPAGPASSMIGPNSSQRSPLNFIICICLLMR